MTHGGGVSNASPHPTRSPGCQGLVVCDQSLPCHTNMSLSPSQGKVDLRLGQPPALLPLEFLHFCPMGGKAATHPPSLEQHDPKHWALVLLSAPHLTF